ncbi:toll/interleukin-1 receptor domain-containing protein [Chryseobacterium sp. S90]|uniref:toll/interleukin-1 receptor domain-containing protein n=1 Tax=Chryseobacterium sp. S90 TaxID=3395373 RepID=UPI0039BC9BEA
MNIFISWSGDTSMKIAEEIKNWIPKVLQSAKPYYTPSDIEKGTKWEAEINQKLSECVVGIICLTSDNTEKPWILFEAGALSNRLDKSKVCPLLFGIKKSDVIGPLARFQLTDFNKVDMFKMIKSVNKSLDDKAIDLPLLTEMFDTFYPKLEENVKKILDSVNNPVLKPQRSDRDILEEVLNIVRKQNNQHNNDSTQLKTFQTRQKIYNKHFINEQKFDIGDLVTFDGEAVGEVISSTASLKTGVVLTIKMLQTGALVEIPAAHPNLIKLSK